MALNKKGKKIKRAMKKEYGMKKGTRVFYASEHKHPDWLKSSSKKQSRKFKLI